MMLIGGINLDIHLQVFIEVVDKSSFSRAAEFLHMTQPAVSQYIKALEERLDTRLLERTNKYINLNKAGEIVYQHALEIRGLYTQMQVLVDDLTEKASGEIKIGASYTFGEYRLPEIISQMKQNYPNIHPSITIGNSEKIAELVNNYQIDIGIIEGYLDYEDLLIAPLVTDSLVLVSAPNHIINENNLEAEQWIVREKGSGTREVTEACFKNLGISPNELLEFSSTQLIKSSVEAGLGISLMSEWVIRREVADNHLKINEIKGLPLAREFSLITKSEFKTRVLDVFIDLIKTNSKQNRLL